MTKTKHGSNKPSAADLELRRLARDQLAAALKTLEAIMKDVESPASSRLAAAKELLDRGFGKVTQGVEVSSREDDAPRVMDLTKLSDDDLNLLQQIAERAESGAGDDAGDDDAVEPADSQDALA
jgi:hypothetical protein